MSSVRRAVLFGFVMWLVPFVVAFAIFPLRESARPLFESIMPVAVAATAVALMLNYIRRVRQAYVRESLLVGLLWLVICVAVDAPLMLLGGPMQMTPQQYLADIGVTYLMIPIVTAGLGSAAAFGARAPAAPQDAA